jgi:hypothetical protein
VATTQSTSDGPVVLGLRYAKAGFVTTLHLAEQHDRGETNYLGYLISDAEIDDIYGHGNVTRDVGRGTIVLVAKDCVGTPLADVSFMVSPAPSAIAYADASGTPSSTQTQTLAAFAYGWALNVLPGPVQITATSSSGSFLVQTYDIEPGFRYVAFVRPVE